MALVQHAIRQLQVASAHQLELRQERPLRVAREVVHLPRLDDALVHQLALAVDPHLEDVLAAPQRLGRVVELVLLAPEPPLDLALEPVELERLLESRRIDLARHAARKTRGARVERAGPPRFYKMLQDCIPTNPQNPI